KSTAVTPRNGRSNLIVSALRGIAPQPARSASLDNVAPSMHKEQSLQSFSLHGEAAEYNSEPADGCGAGAAKNASSRG
ncbi:MAG: hypothetical protein NTY19_44995, partial [Planctomycetota bacterium]|nr:hypothetical protein [Planctomycetota bacterium]